MPVNCNCVLNINIQLEDHRKHRKKQTMTEFQSTRLFPKGSGPMAYRITGVASRCDWVILSDPKPPFVHLHRNLETASPKHIFLSMRSPFKVIDYFADQILPSIRRNFVLISGSEDVTVPNQTDVRWRSFNSHEKKCIEKVLTNKYLLHWFAENLDDASHPIMSPLPLGLLPSPGKLPSPGPRPNLRPLGQRPLTMLCAHRARSGPQWDARRYVTKLAKENWSEFSTVVENELDESEFNTLLGQHAFVLCVEGGGLDPSPKAWLTLLQGAIPIIRSTSLRSAYQQLPVVFVPEWSPEHISTKYLLRWQQSLRPYFDEMDKREKVLKCLSLDYWWDRISSSS